MWTSAEQGKDTEGTHVLSKCLINCWVTLAGRALLEVGAMKENLVELRLLT